MYTRVAYSYGCNQSSSTRSRGYVSSDDGDALVMSKVEAWRAEKAA